MDSPKKDHGRACDFATEMRNLQILDYDSDEPVVPSRGISGSSLCPRVAEDDSLEEKLRLLDLQRQRSLESSAAFLSELEAAMRRETFAAAGQLQSATLSAGRHILELNNQSSRTHNRHASSASSLQVSTTPAVSPSWHADISYYTAPLPLRAAQSPQVTHLRESGKK